MTQAARRLPSWFFALLVAVGTLLPGHTVAAQDDAAQAAARYDIREVMIPARDGVGLHTRIFVPRAQPADAPLPLILHRTPYGTAGAERRLAGAFKELAEEGYIFAFQDIRGKYGSEGTFVMQRPARDPGDAQAIDEGTDTYDTIDWLLRNVRPNNGRVGMLGVSYDGWTTVMATLEPHPALKAVSPQASPADMWLGDDFHHNGAFRLSYGFEYAALMETSKEEEPFAFDRYDTYDWYLALGPLSNVNARYLHGKIPTWNDYVAHPDYDAFWKRQTLCPIIRDVKVPTLNVAGWWDQEDFYGPIRIYDAFETLRRRQAPQLPGRRALEPRRVERGRGTAPGRIHFGSATSRYFRERIQAPWFAYWLKDKGAPTCAEAHHVRGRHQPLARVERVAPARGGGAQPVLPRERHAVVRAAARLGEQRRRPRRVPVRPAHPVPYRHRPIPPTYFPGGSEWTTWLVEDQRFVDDRPDVADAGRPPRSKPISRSPARSPRTCSPRPPEATRLGGQADRRLPGADAGELDAGGRRADGGERGVPRPLPRRFRRARRARPRPGDPVHVQPAHAGLHASARGTGSWCRCRAPGSR